LIICLAFEMETVKFFPLKGDWGIHVDAIPYQALQNFHDSRLCLLNGFSPSASASRAWRTRMWPEGSGRQGICWVSGFWIISFSERKDVPGATPA